MLRWQHLLFASLLLGVAAAACQVVTPAGGLCAGAARDYSGTVVASFNTTIGAIRALEPRAGNPQLWPELAPDHPAVLCYIDGEIAKAPPPGSDGEISRPFDRAAVAIVDGDRQLIIAGYRDQLPVRAP